MNGENDNLDAGLEGASVPSGTDTGADPGVDSGATSPDGGAVPATGGAPGGDATTTAAPASAAPQSPQSIQLSPDTINQLAGALRPQPQQPQMTQEEYNRLMNVYSVSEAELNALGIQATPENVAAFNQILDNKSRQVVTMAQLAVEVLRRNVEQQLAPVREYMETIRMQKLQEEFYAGNKDLRGFEPVVEAVYERLKKQGAQFASKEEAFKALADNVRQVIKRLPGSGGNGNSAATMSTVSMGGRGGASGAAGATGQMSAAQKTAREFFW